MSNSVKDVIFKQVNKDLRNTLHKTITFEQYEDMINAQGHAVISALTDNYEIDIPYVGKFIPNGVKTMELNKLDSYMQEGMTYAEAKHTAHRDIKHNIKEIVIDMINDKEDKKNRLARAKKVKEANTKILSTLNGGKRPTKVNKLNGVFHIGLDL